MFDRWLHDITRQAIIFETGVLNLPFKYMSSCNNNQYLDTTIFSLFTFLTGDIATKKPGEISFAGLFKQCLPFTYAVAMFKFLPGNL